MTDTPRDFDKIVQLWAGGEHLRAGALAAKAKFSASQLEELSILCRGILDHMPAEPGQVRNPGTVPGDPVKSEMDRLGVDEEQIGDINRQRKDEGTSAKAALAKADLKPAGKPRNDGRDGPTLHPHGEQKTSGKPAPKSK